MRRFDSVAFSYLVRMFPGHIVHTQAIKCDVFKLQTDQDAKHGIHAYSAIS